MLGRALPCVLLAAWLCACGPKAGDAGSGCTKDADCHGGLCLTDKPGGYCSQDCTSKACASGICVARSTSKGAGGQAGGTCGAQSVCLATCTADFDCATAYSCQSVGGSKVCLPKCTTDADCGAGATCSNGACSGSQAIGAPCSSDATCGANGECATSFIDGACTQRCVAQGTDTASGAGCPGNSRCTQVGESQGLCLPSCNADADCRAGYTCDPKTRACRSRCASDAACGLGFSCDVCSGTCNEGKAKAGETGASCARDGDCHSTYCLTPDLGWSGGVCSKDCTQDPNSCPDDSICIDADTASICLQRCTNNFDCRKDYFCQDVGGGDSVCIPRCNAQNAADLCGGDQPICDPYSGACEPDGGPGSTSVDRVDLGSVTITANQESSELTLPVPADAVSFTVVLEGGLGGQSTLGHLTAPDGTSLFDVNHFDTSAVRIIPVNDGDFGVIYPNSPRLEITPGNYKFSFYNEGGGGPGHAQAFIKRRPGGTSPNSGVLPLNLFFCGVTINGTAVHAADAAANPDIQAVLQGFTQLYGQANIQPGQIQYYDCTQDFSEINTTEGKDSDLRHLFTQSSILPAGNHAMNFFLVHEIASNEPGYITLGIAGGIPGIPYDEGNNASGVAVTTADLGTPDGDAAVSRVMAHEGGHWLGLFHTTEQPGTEHDPLPDTLECDAAHDQNGDSIVGADECQGSGSQYMMFWEANDTATTITSNQTFVLLRNPVVQ